MTDVQDRPIVIHAASNEREGTGISMALGVFMAVWWWWCSA